MTPRTAGHHIGAWLRVHWRRLRVRVRGLFR
jgi:hypothetical protein